MFQQSRFTFRIFFWGILFTLGAALSCPYTVMNIQSSGLAADYLAAGALLQIFIFVLLINPVLGFLNRRFMLREEEMILVYSMALVASAIPSWGIVLNLIPVLSGLSYYANPENRWSETILSHLKPWLLPPPSVSAGFFEGLPEGTPVPYLAWLKPLFIWGLFFLTMFVFSISLMSIFRREWMENEHLVFPLTILPGELVSRTENSLIPPLLKKRLFWFGFAISFLLIFINGLSYYFPAIPYLRLSQTVWVFRRTSYIIFLFSFPVLGLAYLLNLNILFSLWFFELLAICEGGWFNISGYSLPGHNELQCTFSSATTFQGMGAIIVLVILLFWRSHKRLSAIFRKALRPGNDFDDSKEILTYRQAVWLLILSFLGMFVWLLTTGMGPLVSFLFLVVAFIIILGLTRIVCQAGVGFLRSPCTPAAFISYSLPATAVGENGFANLGLHNIWTSDIRTTVMASAANSLKLTERKPGLRKISFFLLLVAAGLIAYVSSSWLVLKYGYERGALNSPNGWFFQGLPSAVGGFIHDKVLNPPTPEIIRWRLAFAGIGALFMLFLMFMNSRFVWWPLHYIGFPTVDTWVAVNIWFSVFIAWLIKSLILRYGGPKMYQKSIPLFLGFIMGQIVGAGVWLVIDFFTGTIGNGLPVGVG